MILYGNAMIARPLQNERDSGLDKFLRLAIGSGGFSLRWFSRRHATALSTTSGRKHSSLRRMRAWSRLAKVSIVGKLVIPAGSKRKEPERMWRTIKMVAIMVVMVLFGAAPTISPGCGRRSVRGSTGRADLRSRAGLCQRCE